MDSPSLISAFLQAMAARPGESAPAEFDAGHLEVTGSGSLPSAFAVTELAVAAIGSAALALTEYMNTCFGRRQPATVDRRLASFWFHTSLRPQGWVLPDARDPVTGDYRTRDGWIRLHANMPPHRAAELRVLGVEPEPQTLRRAISTWDALALETAIVQAGGCAAMMRTQEEWARHPQGLAVSGEPLFHYEQGGRGLANELRGTLARPLAGLKVLDLTRVLAGPVSTRFLAAYGAQVLRIDPPFWVEPGMVPEVTLGKRCALLDFRDPAQWERFKSLLGEADVLVHGYRPDALERLGLGAQVRQRIRPGLVDVCLDAYGWTGPWSGRRGFDSLVQMSNGFAHTGMRHFGTDRPTPLPVQALDQATGYLMAAAVLRGLTRRRAVGQGSTTRLSLARTAVLLASLPGPGAVDELGPETPQDCCAEIERTAWGPAHRFKPPCEIRGAPMQWDYPACALRSSSAQWLPAG